MLHCICNFLWASTSHNFLMARAEPPPPPAPSKHSERTNGSLICFHLKTSKKIGLLASGGMAWHGSVWRVSPPSFLLHHHEKQCYLCIISFICFSSCLVSLFTFSAKSLASFLHDNHSLWHGLVLVMLFFGVLNILLVSLVLLVWCSVVWCLVTFGRKLIKWWDGMAWQYI